MKRILLLSLLLAVVPASAWSAGRSGTMAWGPRVGFSSSPDQIVLGAGMIVGDVAPDLTFNPSLDIGIGDNRTLFGFNFDLQYHFRSSTSWRPYVGAGATVNNVSYDHDHFGNRDSETFAGGNILVGANAAGRTGTPFFGELKLGLGDVPDLKVMVGWYFRM